MRDGPGTDAPRADGEQARREEARQIRPARGRAGTPPWRSRSGTPNAPHTTLAQPIRHAERFVHRALAQPFRHVERLAYRPPHGLRVHAIGECLVHRAAAQPRQHEILGHAFRVGVAELCPHPLPEHRQPHGARLPAAPGRTRQGNSRGTIVNFR